MPSRHVEATLKFKGRGNKVKPSWIPSRVASEASLARMSLILRSSKNNRQPRRPSSAASERRGVRRCKTARRRRRREIRPSSARMARDHQRNEMEGNDKELKIANTIRSSSSARVSVSR